MGVGGGAFHEWNTIGNLSVMKYRGGGDFRAKSNSQW